MYYKLGQVLLQNEIAFLYYKAGQAGLKTRSGITKWYNFYQGQVLQSRETYIRKSAKY